MLETGEKSENHKLYVKLKHIQIEIINYYNIVNTWYQNIAAKAVNVICIKKSIKN